MKSRQLSIYKYIKFNPYVNVMVSQIVDLLRESSILSVFMFWNKIVLGKKPNKSPMEGDDLHFSFTVDLLTLKGFCFAGFPQV